jgi:hypothetical protein
MFLVQVHSYELLNSKGNIVKFIRIYETPVCVYGSQDYTLMQIRGK